MLSNISVNFQCSFLTTPAVRILIECSRTFAALHQISRGKIDHILKQITDGQSDPHPCQRGKHGIRPHKISYSVTAQVKQHISQFPVEFFLTTPAVRES